MKIVSIFEPHLFAFCFDENDMDEFERAFDFWSDLIQLEAYFNQNTQLLSYNNLTIEQAILQTQELADKFYDTIEREKNNLDSMFRPLIDQSVGKGPLEKQKSKEKWLRLYALKVESKYYVVTGSALKQSQTMQEHPDTESQLKKLEKCKAYLKEEGVTDIEGLKELIIE